MSKKLKYLIPLIIMAAILLTLMTEAPTTRTTSHMVSNDTESDSTSNEAITALQSAVVETKIIFRQPTFSDGKHRCHMCDYAGNKKQDLERHLRSHTGERPFACDQCSYRCNQKHRLTGHKKIHLKPPPKKKYTDGKYSCTECEYAADFKSILKRHLRKHTGERPFACTQCPYRASEQGTLDRHLKTGIHTLVKKRVRMDNQPATRVVRTRLM